MPRGIHRQGEPLTGSKRKGSFDRAQGMRDNTWRCQTNDDCRGDYVCRRGRCLPPTYNPHDDALSLPDQDECEDYGCGCDGQVPIDCPNTLEYGCGGTFCYDISECQSNPNNPYCSCDEITQGPYCDCSGNINNGCGCDSYSPMDCPNTLEYGCGGTFCYDISECATNADNPYCDCDGNTQGPYCDCNGNIDNGCGCNSYAPIACPDTLEYGCGGIYCDDISECESNLMSPFCNCNGVIQGPYCDCTGNIDEMPYCDCNGNVMGPYCDCVGNIDNGCGCNSESPMACPDTLEYGCGGHFCWNMGGVQQCTSNTNNPYCSCDGIVQESYCDCDGNIIDDCGVCGGDGSSCGCEEWNCIPFDNGNGFCEPCFQCGCGQFNHQDECFDQCGEEWNCVPMPDGGDYCEPCPGQACGQFGSHNDCMDHGCGRGGSGSGGRQLGGGQSLGNK